MLVLPILGRRIPIVADDAVDMSFGSGAVKVTPAHDHNDFEIGKRHNLPMITVMNFDGTMNAAAGPFEGMTIAHARSAVVDRLKEDGALIDVTPHTHSVGHCERCGTVVEPMISKQWFVEMGPLAKPAIDAAYSGDVYTSCLIGSKASTSTGWKTSTIGAFRASSGGDIAFRSGIASRAVR